MSLQEIGRKSGELAQEVGKTAGEAAKKFKQGVEMGMTQEVTVIDVDHERNLKNISLISYALHTVVAVGAVIPTLQFSPLLLVLAFVLDLWKKGEARGSWMESHFAWRIRSTVWAMVLYALTSWMWLLFLIPGWIAWGLISLWFLYRVVRGFMALSERRPMPI